MKTSLLSGGALSICVAAMMLGGCGGPHTYFGPSSLQQDASRASGGTFTAKYKGTYYIQTKCTYKQFGRLGFDGNGHARFLGLSNEYGGLITRYNGRACVPFVGSDYLTSTQYPSDEISVNLSEGRGCQLPTFCFRVVSGTGKFANAAGSGTVWLPLNVFGGGRYHDKWNGTITY
jgi:hypothetical protein